MKKTKKPPNRNAAVSSFVLQVSSIHRDETIIFPMLFDFLFYAYSMRYSASPLFLLLV